MNKILEVAVSYIGEKEIKGNQGFKNKSFEKKMEAVGFVRGYAWCCLFAELCWVEGISEKKKELTKLFSASVSKTQNNFIRAKGYCFDQEPTPGSLAIFRVFRNGRIHWTGHIGIVEEYDAKTKTFTCIEGNTNSKGCLLYTSDAADVCSV